MSNSEKTTPGGLVSQPIRLTITRKGQPLTEQIFQHTPIRVGRLNDNDVVLPFDFVSRYHCEIRFDGEQWVAVDLGSKNGLMLDASTRAQEVRLEDGSEFGIQEVTIHIAAETVAEKTNFNAIREAQTVIADVDMPATRTEAVRRPPSAPPPKQIEASHYSDSVTGHDEVVSHASARVPLVDVDQNELLFVPHPYVHQARERAVQMIVLWHDVVIDAREFGIGERVMLDWRGETLDLGEVRADKTLLRVPSGCKVLGQEQGKNGLPVSVAQPNAFRVGDYLRVSFRYVPRSRALVPSSFLPEDAFVKPLIVSSAIHGAAVVSTMLAPTNHRDKPRQEPERFAAIIVAPTPPPIAMQPKPTPTPAPTPVQVAKEEPPEREKPKPRPTPKKIVKRTEKPIRKLAEKRAEEKRIEKPVVDPPKVKPPEPVKVALKEPPAPAPVVEKPAPAPTPVFNAKKVGALKMLDMMKAGAASNVANIEKIRVSRSPATAEGSVMGREPVEGTGEIISKLNQSATGGGTGKGDGMTGVALGGKGAAGSYQTAGLVGKAGKRKIQGTVLGGATYSELRKTEGLSREQVMKVVAAHQAQIQACYERSLMSNPDIVGRAEFEWEIAAPGNVKFVTVKEATVKNGESLLDCVKGVFGKMKFPVAKNGESTTPTIGLPFGRL